MKTIMLDTPGALRVTDTAEPLSPRKSRSPFLEVDLSDLARTVETLRGADAVVHPQVNRWTGVPIVSLRFSTIMELHNFAQFLAFQDDP